MVPSEQRLRVEAVLRDMLIGQSFCRVHFYGTPILYLWGPRPAGIGPWLDRSDGGDTASLYVESRWQLFDAAPPRWPRNDEDLPERPMEELVAVACGLRKNAIVDAQLGVESPHLILTFDDGRILFINGHHDQYESWQLYAGQGRLLIVAVPGDELAMWLPEDYRQEPADEAAL